MFICNHCPFVKHIEDELIKLSNEYMIQGIGVAGISSNDIINYPDDAPEKMKELAETKGYPFPIFMTSLRKLQRPMMPHVLLTSMYLILKKNWYIEVN
jgi:hypothetical protein